MPACLNDITPLLLLVKSLDRKSSKASNITEMWAVRLKGYPVTFHMFIFANRYL